jgi:uncharacterized protein
MKLPSPMQEPANAHCAACGAEFECGAERGECWCGAMPPLALIEPGRGCLCPTCLAEELRKIEGLPN